MGDERGASPLLRGLPKVPRFFEPVAASRIGYSGGMERSPLDAATAAAFLRRLGEHLDYNVNIMNREGVIIASRDPSRVGSYHEAAHRLVVQGAAEERIEPGERLPQGARPGVNLPITYKGETIGVVGVTGDPREVGPLAYAVKTSVESMIELEAFRNLAMRRQDRKNAFINSLLYEDGFSRGATEALGRKLGYDPRLHRAALLIRPPQELPPEESLGALKSASAHGREDLSWAAPDGLLLVFKTIRFGEEGLLAVYQSELTHYLASAGRAFGLGEALPPAWAGAFQSEFARYRGSYRQALWLAERFPEGSAQGPLHIYDYLGEFLASRIPRAELVDALESLAALVPREFAPGLRESVEALFESAFNGKEAAARLGVHRNTLAARLERLRRVFGIDPRRDPRARELFPFLARYFELRGGGGN